MVSETRSEVTGPSPPFQVSSTFHEIQAVSVCLLLEPAPPATSTQCEQGGDTHITVWVSEQTSWSVWALFGVRMWQH